MTVAYSLDESYSYPEWKPHNYDTVLRRISDMRREGMVERSQRERIRNIMDGGVPGIQAIMAWDQGRQGSIDKTRNKFGEDLPAVNLMASGVERLAQRVGDMPNLHAAEAHQRELREEFAMRRAIVHDWDQYEQLRTHYPQIGRWLPGYTHCLWTICQGWYGYADKPIPYPKVTLRDSFDIYPGFGYEPDDVMVLRKVPLRVLKAHYPDIAWGEVEQRLQKGNTERGITAWASGTPGGYSRWEGPETGVEVCEYMDAAGRSLVIPDASMPLSFVENPIWPEPPFVVMRRYSFNANISAYHHVIGLVAMMAKLNILGLVASQDSVFRETNVTGEVESGEYRFGRGVVNILSPGSKVEKLSGDQAQTLWAQIDRLERQLRIGAAYDVSSDGISPNSYATQAGIQELQSGTARNVNEYQQIIQLATQRLDSRRLMWADRVWPKRKTKIYHFTTKKRQFYTPSKDIAGDYRTRRSVPIGGMYGTPTEVVNGLQLLSAEVVGVEEVQDNIPGIGDTEAILARIRAKKAEKILFERMAAQPPGAPPTPPGSVEAMLVEIMADPEDYDEILARYAKPPEPDEMVPEGMPPELAALGGGAGGPPGAPPGIWDAMAAAGGEPPVQTTMSRVMSNNTADAGVQLVGRMG